MKKILKRLLQKIFYHLRFLMAEAVNQGNKDTLTFNNTFLTERIADRGSNIDLKGEIYISHPKMVVLGDNVHIGNGAYFHTDGGLLIGDNTHISRNTTIYTSNHNYFGNRIPYDENRIYKPVRIKENVWIGMNVNISPGVTIGEGAIIGMGTTVNKDVPPMSVVGSNPNRILKERSREHYFGLKDSKRFGGINGHKYTPSPKAKSIFDLGEKLFFVVGTGRSGSDSISKILSQHPDITCRHEAKGELIRLSTEFEYGKINRKDLKRELIEIYSSTKNIETEFYGESDQKLSNLISVLSEIFPEAKFIWLLRKGNDVVNSTYCRGWFDDREFGYPLREKNAVKSVYPVKLYSDFRLNGGNVQNSGYSQDKWFNATPFERNCWYWSYWNLKIEENLNKISNDHIMIRLENLQDDLEKIKKLISFPEFSFQIRKSNGANYKLLEKWEEYQIDAFNEICEPLMNKWYSNHKS